MSDELVLVTGGSGFIAAHCVRQLLERGYRVRATVRSAQREAGVRAMVGAGGGPAGEALSFAVADLTSDDGWAAAAAGCDYVLHVASPFPAEIPKDEDEIIVPAREGTLRVLRAARGAGVRRTVLTSSFAAVGYGHPDTERVYTEDDWTKLDGEPLIPYVRSKVLAERAAWDFVAREGNGMELATVNPVAVFGPALGPDFSLYIDLVRDLMNGKLPALPKIRFSVVDVRDVADLHLRAMTDPAAAGERFLAVAGEMTLPEIAAVLRDRLGDAARRVPTRTLPDWLVRAAARFSGRIAQVAPSLGVIRSGTAEKAQRVLGWRPRPVGDTVTDTATSLSALGLLREPPVSAG